MHTGQSLIALLAKSLDGPSEILMLKVEIRLLRAQLLRHPCGRLQIRAVERQLATLWRRIART